MTIVFQPTPLVELPAFDPHVLVGEPARAIDPELRPAFDAQGPAKERLEQLFGTDALCVTTGQQPGILTGPLFTVYKALTAVALARFLERVSGRTVVPVFWVAGDDHDFAEANHTYLLTLQNEIERLSLRTRASEAPSLPLYRELLGAEIDDVVAAYSAHTPDTEFRSGVLDWVTRHYRADQDIATAFAGAVAELLGPYGMVVFSPTHVAAKRAIAPLLIQVLMSSVSLDKDLSARATQLRQAGKATPVDVGDGAVPVMLEAALGRDRLMLDGDGFVTRRSGESWALADLESLAASEPQRLSPNVLLRPVVEAAVLPTLAYVAGPGELSYLPQAEPLYRGLNVSPQLAFPRWSGRVIETRISKVLAKYGISADDLNQADGQLEATLVRDDMPAEASSALAGLRRTISTDYPRLLQAAAGVDPTLRKPVQSAQNSALAGVADVERRIVSHLKKRNDIVVQQLAKARNNLFPRGRPQERLYNVLGYLVRYGPAFLDVALETIESSLHSLDPDSIGS